MSRIAISLAFIGIAEAAVTLPAWFGDNMVLQTNEEYGARSFLNGKARPGEHVVVDVEGGGTFPAVAGDDGEWAVQMNHISSPRITVSGEDGPPVIALNVSGGDVFFCSGQSNMVFPLKLTLNASAEIKTLASFPQFRFFMTARDTSDTPLWDLRSNHTSCDTKAQPGCNRWVTASQASSSGFIQDFSAVCYMTVRDIARMHTGTRPMALIQSAWGGTRVEAWMSAKAIDTASRSIVTGWQAEPPKRTGPNARSVLFNAMVAPWQKFAVRAALWYQGEANADQKVSAVDAAHGVDQTSYYSIYLQAMIADWRDRKGMGDFAFLVVSLPPSVAVGTPASKQSGTGRPQIRLAEQQVSPHREGLTDISGVAVTVDLGGASAWGFDHPCNKNEISRRLALQGVHAAYAQQGRIPNGSPAGATSSLWTGPLLEDVRALGSAETQLTFTSWSAVGLSMQDVKAQNIDGSSNNCTRCCSLAPPFELLQAGRWMRVPFESIRVDAAAAKVTLGAAGSAVRYAYTDYVECVVMNNDSLPLAPFVRNITAHAATAHTVPDSTLVEADAEADGSTPAVRSSPYPAARPPMGFNSWNYYHCNIDEQTLKAIVDAVASNGMREAGYEYINIDDCWQVQRFPNQTIQPDPVRFPSGMKAMADYAHSKGLKFGVYTARGSRTCQNRPGAYSHEELDAATYCDWGLDYLKNDNCGGTNWKAENTSWIKFQSAFDECFKRTGRYIVKSIEYCRDVQGCGQWIGGVANLWRTVGDVQATWCSVLSNIHLNNKMAPVVNNGQATHNGQGNFNDADMLEIGNVGLTATEQYSMMSLWSIAGSPLLAGTDIIHASPQTIKILANAEVTSINQDLGLHGRIQGTIVAASSRHPTNSTIALLQAPQRAGRRVLEGELVDWQATSSEVWCKHLADGHSVAVVLLNLEDSHTVNVTTPLAALGMTGPVAVRDLWAHADLPKAASTLTATVPPHGTRMFKLVSTVPVTVDRGRYKSLLMV